MDHAAARVGDRWYVAGGFTTFEATAEYPTEVDVYDPVSGHWSVAGQLTQGREDLIAIPDAAHSRALFVGGAVGGDFSFLGRSDLVTGDNVSRAADLLHARDSHAGAFAAGKYIVSGGWGMDGPQLDDAEMLDDPSSSWRPAGTMPTGPRAGHTMTTLANGREVLVVGGSMPDHAFVQVDRFDAACGRWSMAAALKVPRVGHAAALLSDGRVLVTGGISFPPMIRVEPSAEIYDPAANQWTMGAPMQDARYDHDMVLLPDGRVLVAGGTNDLGHPEFGALASAELYDPVADAWTPLPPMSDHRQSPTLAVLPDGVYVAGGADGSGTSQLFIVALASVERLSWSDLGITVVGPSVDAGPDGSAERNTGGALASCSTDGSASPDGARDGGVDLAAQDAAPNDGARGRGCSCEAQPGNPVVLDVAIVLGLAIGARRRLRQRSR